jgi:hypothetical protein
VVALHGTHVLHPLAQLLKALVQQTVALDIPHFAASFLIEPIQLAPLPGGVFRP